MFLRSPTLPLFFVPISLPVAAVVPILTLVKSRCVNSENAYFPTANHLFCTSAVKVAHIDSHGSAVGRRLYKDNILDNRVRNRNTCIRKTKDADNIAQPVDNSHTDTACKASNSYRNWKGMRKRYDGYTSVARNNLPILQHPLTLILPIPPQKLFRFLFFQNPIVFLIKPTRRCMDSRLAYNIRQMRPLLKAVM